MRKICTIILLIMAYGAYAHVPVFGHRGGIWGVENTAECYREGAKWFDGLETDTKVTKDSIIVCHHDANFSNFYKDATCTTKYTADESKIATHTLAELQAMPMTQRNAWNGVVYTDTICTFGTYLDICRENKIIAMVEIKWADNWFASNSTAGMPLLMEELKKHQMLDHCILMSGIEKCLNWIRERPEYDSIPCQYLGFNGDQTATMAILTAWAEKHEGDVDPECYQIINKAQVDTLHAKNIKVAVWNITNRSSYNKYKSYGVDYMTADSLRPMFLPDYTPHTDFIDVKHIPAPLECNKYGWETEEDMYQGLAADIIEGKSKYRMTAFKFSKEFETNKQFSAISTDLNASGIAKDITAFDVQFFTTYAAKWGWLRNYIDARCEKDGVTDTQDKSTRSEVIRYNLAAFFANTQGQQPKTANYTQYGIASKKYEPYWKSKLCLQSGWEQVACSRADEAVKIYRDGRLYVCYGDKVYDLFGQEINEK